MTYDAETTNEAKEDFLLVPPASTLDFGLSHYNICFNIRYTFMLLLIPGTPKPVFDEYRTSIDENELIVRVTKNTRTVCQISRDTNSEELPLCPDGETVIDLANCLNQNQFARFTYPKQYTMTVEDAGNDVCLTAFVLLTCD